MPKTNNAIEGWHTGFEATLDAVHPNIFRFVIAGQPLAKKKKVYLDNAAQITVNTQLIITPSTLTFVSGGVASKCRQL